jgi:hypothetical protein
MVAGFPQVEAYFGTYDLSQAFCNLGAVYQDSPPIFICEGTTRIIRTWTVLDWCATGSNSMLELTQIIRVGDSEGPAVVCPSTANGAPLVYYTAPFACSASFQAPLPEVTDNCSSWRVDTYVIKDEVVPVTNQFGIITGYDTVAVILQTIAPNAPRLVSGLEVGCYRFRYKVTDDCNNFTVIECDFCIEDNIAPSAVCKDVLNVSLGGMGYGRIFAADVDAGSWDNCGIEQLGVRRQIAQDTLNCEPVTPYYTDWGNYVDFNCCDVGQAVIVELRVLDIYGNENACWMEVSIEDKVRPFCQAPPNASILCTEIPFGFDFGNTLQLESLFGSATATDNCAVEVVVEELAPIIDVNTCGYGNVTRRFRAIDAAGNFSINTCQQSIAVLATHNYEIKFPKDIVTDCTVPEPDTLTYTELACDLLAVSVTDDIFTPLPGSGNPECYTIFRTWRVINWCEYDGEANAVIVGRNEDCDGTPGDEDVWVLRRPTGTYIDRDNDHTNNIPAFGTKGFGCDGTTNPTGYWRTATSTGFWEYTQIIKVMDSTPPQIAFTPPAAFCSSDAATCQGAVLYPFTITENCSPVGLSVQVFLDLGANGTIDQDLTGTAAVGGSYPNYQIQGQFPLGNHAFIVHAADVCGNNMAAATLSFTVADCVPPAAACIDGLAVPLMLLPPETDFDGDGEFDLAGAAVWASDFIVSSSDCSDDTIAYSINRLGEPADFNQEALYFTCADTGTIVVEIYTWDSAFNPYAVQPDGSIGGRNYSVCQVSVVVQDPNGHCVPPAFGPMMAGLIAREDMVGVENVMVSLSGQLSMQMLTAADGTYEFVDLETGYDYTLAPYLNDDHNNGVTTLDLIRLQQHLLGIQLLDSPYKMIAADVNKSGQITTLDMIEIQQIILGVKEEFSNNTSWRFVAASYVFPVPSNPWFAVFPEVINVNNLLFSTIANNFVAIKVGDVNNSAVTSSLQPIEERNFVGGFRLSVPEQSLRRGELVAVPFTARQIDEVYGYQFTLDFDRDALELREVEYGIADEHSLGLHALLKGYLTASWYRPDDLPVADKEEEPVMFTLVFEARRDARLSELLRISSRQTVAEAYSPGLELLDVVLEFEGESAAPSAAFRLYQNYPNPFEGETTIGFELPWSGRAELSVFDAHGRLLKTYPGEYSQGYNELRIRREELPATGLLYYRLQMGELVASRKMILLR